jgi:hypothetical protein
MRTIAELESYIMSETYMTAKAFEDAQARLRLSDRALAVSLGLSEANGHVQVRRIKNGVIACSGPIAGLMLAFLAGYRTPWFVEV